MTLSKLSAVQAIFFDIDNTLIGPGEVSKYLTPELKNLIIKLEQLNIRIGVCTGRASVAVSNKILVFFSEDSLHITAGGSQLTQANGKVIWQQNLPKENTESLVKMLLKQNATFYVAGQKKLYATNHLLERLMVHRFDIPVEDASKLDHYQAPLLTIYNLTPEIEKLIEPLTKNLTVKKMISPETKMPYADITGSGVNKASALEKWSEITGLDQSKIVAIGDSENDLEILKAVGYSLAVENAIPILKNKVHKVIGSVGDHGVEKYLAQILETGQL